MRTLLTAALLAAAVAAKADTFASDTVMKHAEKVAHYFMSHYPDVGADSYVGGKKRNSKIWTRGVFYEGLLNIYREKPKPEWLKYAEDWGNHHRWISSTDNEARSANADYQCCGQAYLELYRMKPEPVRMEHIKMRIDAMLKDGRKDYWWWIDAIQMSMPVFALLGDITGNEAYWNHMYDLYAFTRNSHGGTKKGGGKPLFNTASGLWYRDYQYDPPYRDLTETDKDCYWSRGNGWVYMALARVMQFTPASESHRAEYADDYLKMSRALLQCQREDGSWNVSLAAPTNFGAPGSEGPEMTGTSLFVGGMAYGVRCGLLDSATYMPAIRKGWLAMRRAVHDDTGFVGYLQGTGAKPEDGGATTYNSVPNFEDFGYGCWLWGAAEVHALAKQIEAEKTAIVDVSDERNVRDDSFYDLSGRRVAQPAEGGIYVRNKNVVIFRK